MNILKSIQNLFTKEVKETEKQPVLIQPVILPEPELFTCHHCHYQFEVQSKDIFPVSVPVLYENNYVQGKGVLCPECKQNSIFG